MRGIMNNLNNEQGLEVAKFALACDLFVLSFLVLPRTYNWAVITYVQWHYLHCGKIYNGWYFPTFLRLAIKAVMQGYLDNDADAI